MKFISFVMVNLLSASSVFAQSEIEKPDIVTCFAQGKIDRPQRSGSDLVEFSKASISLENEGLHSIEMLADTKDPSADDPHTVRVSYINNQPQSPDRISIQIYYGEKLLGESSGVATLGEETQLFLHRRDNYVKYDYRSVKCIREKQNQD